MPKKTDFTWMETLTIGFLKSREPEKAKAMIEAAFPSQHLHKHPKRKFPTTGTNNVQIGGIPKSQSEAFNE